MPRKKIARPVADDAIDPLACISFAQPGEAPYNEAADNHDSRAFHCDDPRSGDYFTSEADTPQPDMTIVNITSSGVHVRDARGKHFVYPRMGDGKWLCTDCGVHGRTTCRHAKFVAAQNPTLPEHVLDPVRYADLLSNN